MFNWKNKIYTAGNLHCVASFFKNKETSMGCLTCVISYFQTLKKKKKKVFINYY